jgi:hypothetical protein
MRLLADRLNDWWEGRKDIVFVAEDTMVTVYQEGLFAGAIHWSIVSERPLTMIVSLADDPRCDTADLRLFLMRALSALLPAYILIRGSNIKI